MARRLTLLAAGLFLLGACSSGPSLTEYAEDIEAVVTAHNTDMDANDVYLDGETQTLERIKTYATRRMELRESFLEGLEALDPPDEAEDLHNAAVETIRSLVESERVLFEQATGATDIAAVGDIWASPEGQAARAADAQAIAICQAAEAAINSTEERQALVGMPWVPTELQEVVTVAFGCTAADR
jgi:hypothetical protein